jgi:hypothetical protein
VSETKPEYVRVIKPSVLAVTNMGSYVAETMRAIAQAANECGLGPDPDIILVVRKLEPPAEAPANPPIGIGRKVWLKATDERRYPRPGEYYMWDREAAILCNDDVDADFPHPADQYRIFAETSDLQSAVAVFVEKYREESMTTGANDGTYRSNSK